MRLVSLIFVLISSNAFAISSPLQQSKNMIQLALAANALPEFARIRSMSVNIENRNLSVSIIFHNEKNECKVQLIPMIADRHGDISVMETTLPPTKSCPSFEDIERL